MSDELELQRQLQRINHNAVFISNIARSELPIKVESNGDRVITSACIKVPNMETRQFVDEPCEITPQMLAELEVAADNTMAQSRLSFETAKRLVEEIEIVRQRIKTERAKINIEL
jgi:hypothetical protein